jgi:hypothetical protein
MIDRALTWVWIFSLLNLFAGAELPLPTDTPISLVASKYLIVFLRLLTKHSTGAQHPSPEGY